MRDDHFTRIGTLIDGLVKELRHLAHHVPADAHMIVMFRDSILTVEARWKRDGQDHGEMMDAQLPDFDDAIVWRVE